MKKIEGIPDKGVWCPECKTYYWYTEIKECKCPKGHEQEAERCQQN